MESKRSLSELNEEEVDMESRYERVVSGNILILPYLLRNLDTAGREAVNDDIVALLSEPTLWKLYKTCKAHVKGAFHELLSSLATTLPASLEPCLKQVGVILVK